LMVEIRCAGKQGAGSHAMDVSKSLCF